jgi:Leucine-rich repeat (LRR) protein
VRAIKGFILLIPLFVLIAAFTGSAGTIGVDPYSENMLYDHCILGMNTVRINSNAIIHSGNVGTINSVEEAQPEPVYTSSYFRYSGVSAGVSSNLHIDSGVFCEIDTSLYADSVVLERGASVYNLYCNELVNEGEVRGEAGLLSEQSYEIYFPDLPDPEPGLEDHFVSWGERKILPPGQYRRVAVCSNGTLVLTGGLYHFEDLELGFYNARVLVQGPAEIVISNRLFSFFRAYIGPDKGSGITAKDIVMYVHGEDGQYGFFRGYPKAVQLGRYSEVLANIYVPNGTLWIRRDSLAKGAFFGRDVIVGYEVEVTLDAYKPAGMVTEFADPNLEQAVREALGIPDGPLFISDLEGLTMLNASGRKIADLRGIEDCVNLQSLILEYNAITDIGPLATLVNLFALNLNYNNVSDLSPIAGLTNLTRLYLGGNSIGDDNLYSIENLINISYLTLDSNGLTDIYELSDMTKLYSLSLSGNMIKDISPLKGCTELSVLDLNNNMVADISPLSELSSLKVLYLYNNEISNLYPLMNLTNLENLVLDNNGVVDIMPLANLKKLTMLYLNDNDIKNVTALGVLVNLRTLFLENNEIYSIGALAGLTNLTELYLGYNSIIDISALSGLLQLDTLYLNHNLIESISALVTNAKSELGGLGEGDLVYLVGNPLDNPEAQSDIADLQSRGIYVYWY